ncbi:MAG: bacteriophage CI repressor [Desulfobacteraceae bacterium]|nr:bacteriophage CI repressor [Desulfobacteraceae bacterium]
MKKNDATEKQKHSRNFKRRRHQNQLCTHGGLRRSRLAGWSSRDKFLAVLETNTYARGGAVKIL